MKLNRWYFPMFITILIVTVGVLGFMKIYNYWQNQTISINQPIVNKVNKSNESPNLKEIIHETEKHVVQIESQSGDVITTGSGFLYNDKGDIITNAHVIKNSDFIHVRTANAHIYPAAPIGIGDNTDIAVIRVPQLARQSYLQIEDHILPEIGDPIIAVGSPHGFQNTVTLGIISGVERNFIVDGFDYKNVYQISAQISQGNSGGPLINMETGNVIGINSVGTGDGTIGFSIPIHEVIDHIVQWSNEAVDDKLDFASMSDILSSYDPEQLETDALYLINYFLEGIQIRDYLISYTLLGSKMQSELSYVDFRDIFTHIVKLDYTQDSITINDNHLIDINLKLDVERKSKGKDEVKSETLDYIFTIGLENDQLRILKIINSK